VTTATLGARTTHRCGGRAAIQKRRDDHAGRGTTGTRPLDEAVADGADVPPFASSSRPAWQPMPVKPPQSAVD
jgi:hypothetical protein